MVMVCSTNIFATMAAVVPIRISHLFRPLDAKLMDLLDSLSAEEWNKPTVAKQWTVKDVVSHLLDGNLRALSIQKERYVGDNPPAIHGYDELVRWLNELNADWVKATRRVSPAILKVLHKATGELVSSYFESLDLWDEAIFPVSWAGESKSYNWMHLAREYTEKWHHQQQIRDAVGNFEILTKELYYPVLDTFFRALPHVFRDINATDGTTVRVNITGEAGGSWFITRKEESWDLLKESILKPDAVTIIPQEIAWKLFTKSIRAAGVRNRVEVRGDMRLGMQVLKMVAVMA